MRTEDPSREPANEDARDGSRVQSVDRAVMLLRAISTSAHPPTAWELARACGINRSTAWRLLQTLEHHALVERDPTTGRYGIGYTALEVAASAGYDGLARRARPILERVAQDAGESVMLAAARRFSLVYVDQVDPPTVPTANWLGRQLPLHATSTGKAYLAFMTREERDTALPARLERFTATTVTDRRTLETQLAEVRRAGFATCVGELEESLFGASAPVLSEQARPVAIVSVWGTEHRLPRERLDDVGERALAAAAEIKDVLR